MTQYINELRLKLSELLGIYAQFESLRFIYLEIDLTYHLFHNTDFKWQEKSKAIVCHSIEFLESCIKCLLSIRITFPDLGH